jgi:hypothetical protein
MLARTDDSLKLKRTLVIVSVDVGNVRFDTGALLLTAMSTLRLKSTVPLTLFHPISGQDLTQSQKGDLFCDDL